MIQSVTIRDYDDPYAPPENVLDVAIVGRRVFFSINKYDQTATESTSKVVATVTVDLQTLLDALAVLHNADVRLPSAKA